MKSFYVSTWRRFINFSISFLISHSRSVYGVVRGLLSRDLQNSKSSSALRLFSAIKNCIFFSRKSLIFLRFVNVTSQVTVGRWGFTGSINPPRNFCTFSTTSRSELEMEITGRKRILPRPSCLIKPIQPSPWSIPISQPRSKLGTVITFTQILYRFMTVKKFGSHFGSPRKIKLKDREMKREWGVD